MGKKIFSNGVKLSNTKGSPPKPSVNTGSAPKKKECNCGGKK